MPFVKGVNVNICTLDGEEALPEFGVRVSDDGDAHCFIESKPGLAFSIRVWATDAIIDNHKSGTQTQDPRFAHEPWHLKIDISIDSQASILRRYHDLNSKRSGKPYAPAIVDCVLRGSDIPDDDTYGAYYFCFTDGGIEMALDKLSLNSCADHSNSNTPAKASKPSDERSIHVTLIRAWFNGRRGRVAGLRELDDLGMVSEAAFQSLSSPPAVGLKPHDHRPAMEGLWRELHDVDYPLTKNYATIVFHYRTREELVRLQFLDSPGHETRFGQTDDHIQDRKNSSRKRALEEAAENPLCGVGKKAKLVIGLERHENESLVEPDKTEGQYRLLRSTTARRQRAAEGAAHEAPRTVGQQKDLHLA